MRISRILRCSRGAVLPLIAMAAVPLIGIAAMGTEGGVWYVVKRHSQNAADSAAYAGAIQLAIDRDLDPNDENLDSTGRQFAAQNGFCSTGDTAYTGSTCGTLPMGTTQTVTIEPGHYVGTTFTPGGASPFNAARATVTQAQPALLASIALTGDVTVQSQAVAAFTLQQDICALALNGNFTIGGNVNLTGGGCALMSNKSFALNGIDDDAFEGTGWSLAATGGCKPSSKCTNPDLPPHNYYTLSAPDPLAGTLDPSMFTVGTNDITAKNGDSIVLDPSVSPFGHYRDLTIQNGGTVTLKSGTYIFRSITMTGGMLTWDGVGGGVNIVLFGTGSAALKVSGDGSINLIANMSATPAALSGVLFYNAGNKDISVGGNGSVTYSGMVYSPTADVTWHGTPSAGAGNCAGIIGKSVTLVGDTGIDVSGCPADLVEQTVFVMLVK